MNRVRVGIIGFGLSGRYFHSSLISALPQFKITAISSSRTADVKSVFPEVSVFSDPRELVASDDVDLVINCAPNFQHFPLTASALENGKHVVVEKPFVNTIEDGEKLIALAKKSNKVLSVFHNRRWDGDFLTVCDLIKSGQLGRVMQFESHFDRWRPKIRPERWREQRGPGSGILYDLGSHLIDQALVLFGKPDSVVADIAKQRPGSETDDYFHITLTYAETRVILHSSSFASVTPRFQVFGDKANYVKYGLDPQEDQLRAGMSPAEEKFGYESPEKYGTLTLPDENKAAQIVSARGAYVQFYRQIFDAITTSGTNPVLPEEALQVISLIESCQR